MAPKTLKNEIVLELVSGCVGGMSSVVVGHPFDTVKVRMQMQEKGNLKYTGTLDCFVKTIRNESVFGLFKGMLPPLAGIGLINAIIFGVYGRTQKILEEKLRLGPNKKLVSVAIAGSMAGLAQSVIIAPTELVKLRMQLQEDKGLAKYKSPTDCVRQIRQTEGLRGLYRGYGITICREMPAFAIYFATYDVMERMWTEPNSKPNTSSSIQNHIGVLAAGGMAGVFSWIFTYPIDVVKSRVQADQSGRYKGALHCFSHSYRADGLRVFFRGLTPTIIRAFPTNAAIFYGVHLTRRIIGE